MSIAFIFKESLDTPEWQPYNYLTAPHSRGPHNGATNMAKPSKRSEAYRVGHEDGTLYARERRAYASYTDHDWRDSVERARTTPESHGDGLVNALTRAGAASALCCRTKSGAAFEAALARYDAGFRAALAEALASSEVES